jgi:hypothetical protein
MEFLEGKTLKHAIGGRPMEIEKLRDVAIGVAGALYKMATGQLPFRGDSSATILEEILKNPVSSEFTQENCL